MRLQFLNLITVLTLTSSFHVALGGPSEPGGGGNARVSNRMDLQMFVQEISIHMWDVSDRKLVGQAIKVTDQPLKKNLSLMTQTILGTPSFTIPVSIVDYINTLKYEIVDGPCMHNGEERDASTVNKKGAPICLSASRLSRFPKSTLKQVLIPLIFHEVAHQHQFDEADAKAFQDLAELYLTYRPIYLSAMRGWMTCGYASNTATEAQKNEIISGAAKAFGQNLSKVGKTYLSNKDRLQMTCASWAASTGENLDKSYDGNRWGALSLKVVNASEESFLKDLYNPKNNLPLSFNGVLKGLSEPSRLTVCDQCDKHKIDRAAAMMISSKAALEVIEREVAYRQNLL